MSSLAGAGAEPVAVYSWMQFISGNKRYLRVLAIAPHWHRNKDGKAQDAQTVPPAHQRVNRRHFQSWADAMGLLDGLYKKQVSAEDPPSAPALRKALATGKKLWTLDEAAETTSSALWPAFDTAAEGYVTRLLMWGPGGAHVSPDPEQWAELDAIWAGLPKLELPMARADWKAYEDAFESSKKGPRMWPLRPDFCEPADELRQFRDEDKAKHLRMLRAKIKAGRIAAYHPEKPTRVRPGDERIDNKYRVRLDGIARLCVVLGIDAVRPAEKDRIPCILDEARPAAVPPELVNLHDANLVIRKPGCGPERSSYDNSKRSRFICTVGDFRADVEHRIQRQRERGEFTFDEAIQILADEHPGKDAERFAKLLRAALKSRNVLKTLDGADGLPLVEGETFLEDFDFLTASQLDTWLQGMGYGFPTAAAERALAHLALHSNEALEPQPAPKAGQLAPNTEQPERAVPQAQEQALLKPPGAFQAQEAEVLRVLRRLGHEPKKLPPIKKSGKPWVKSEAWREIGECQLFVSKRVFNKAWERLRAEKKIAVQPGP